MSMAKDNRNMSLEIKRQKYIKSLSRWEDFRNRREGIMTEHLMVKQRWTRCNTLITHMKAFLVIKKVYLVIKNEAEKAMLAKRRLWAVFVIG